MAMNSITKKLQTKWNYFIGQKRLLEGSSNNFECLKQLLTTTDESEPKIFSKGSVIKAAKSCRCIGIHIDPKLSLKYI